MTKSLFASPRLVMNLEDCSFYHTVDLPDYGTIPGFWDIRGKESQYLGEVIFKDKRVLEIGPATGQLSFYMDAQGAEVVSIEADDDYASEFFWDFDESVPQDLEQMLELHREHIRKVKNSYWFCHRALASQAKVHYGSAYSLPTELGRFDISVLACVLLHNKNPLLILENCARITEDKIIIVEPFRESQLAQSSAEFLPTNDKSAWKTWWGFSPKFFIDVLRSMGFSYSRVTFHTQECFDAPAYLFTVVASRSPFAETQGSEKPLSVALESPVERLRIRAGKLINLPLSIVNLGEAPISSFSAPPVILSYHWKRKSGEVAVWDGLRTALPRVMHKGDSDDVFVAVRAPEKPGDYLLELSMLEEGIAWYDDSVVGLPLRIETVVTTRSSSGEDPANVST
jgi:SAM-dependent methyltransferase